ncbi:hypothetical protein EJ06DRAFT_35423 [Trichodelitschia bisporula]|uniref:F-box domain-containing protein n=1 Tax=Trichodelitschia bisporula TaxID=703511 RepID=A0A6G1HV46_9PEZI|nr:hypothetical protein EJ06DRAFT_35423 [Trichodelitschia bisporula]
MPFSSPHSAKRPLIADRQPFESRLTLLPVEVGSKISLFLPISDLVCLARVSNDLYSSLHPTLDSYKRMRAIIMYQDSSQWESRHPIRLLCM